MIGGSTASAQAGAAANVGTLVGGSAQAKAQYGNNESNSGSIAMAPIALLGVVVLYLFWAIVLQHEKVKSQLSPSNVAINIHNILVVGLTAMLFLLLGKVVTAKAVIAGIPGVSWLAQLFQAA